MTIVKAFSILVNFPILAYSNLENCTVSGLNNTLSLKSPTPIRIYNVLLQNIKDAEQKDRQDYDIKLLVILWVAVFA